MKKKTWGRKSRATVPLNWANDGNQAKDFRERSFTRRISSAYGMLLSAGSSHTSTLFRL
jgi:hypothetical protein